MGFLLLLQYSVFSLTQIIEGSTAPGTSSTLELDIFEFCKYLPDVMQSMKPGDKIAVQHQHEFTSRLLQILEICQQHNKPIGPFVLEALSKMMPLLGRNGVKRYSYILIFHLSSILRAKTTTETDQILYLSIGLVGDLFLTLKSDSSSLFYLDGFLPLVELLLNREEMNVEVRSHCIVSLRKIATVLGVQRFLPYLPATLQLLHESSNIIPPDTVAVSYHLSVH